MTTVRPVLQLRRGEPGLEAARATSRSILFWGIMSLLLGALGTVVGLVVMAEAVHHVGGGAVGGDGGVLRPTVAPPDPVQRSPAAPVSAALSPP